MLDALGMDFTERENIFRFLETKGERKKKMQRPMWGSNPRP